MLFLPGMRRTSFLWRSGLVGSCLALLLAAGCGKKEKAQAPPPPTVEVMEVIQKDVPVYSEWVGTADGLVNATIRAQVTGYLLKQNYRDGELVRAGQVLFEIDPRTFQAAVDAAKGALAQAQARWTTAKATLDRVRPLAARNAVSQKDLDDAVGAEQSTGAAVESAKAQLEEAQLNLGFTRVASPVAGIAGIAKAQVGNLVGPGQTQELATVSTVDPIKVYFSLSEQEYMRFRGGAGAKASETRAEDIPLELILADGTVYPRKGRVSLADRQVDVRTGTLRIGALFPNPGNLLRPGQFALIRATMETKKGALLVPQRAVQQSGKGHFVWLVDKDGKAELRPVTVGDWYEDSWFITEGLRAGEQLVVDGALRLSAGATVVVTSRDGVATAAKPAAAAASR